ncbi:lysozyme [Bacillus phage SWEP1]|nr:lysozyme [Bacillus phage SWEP1]
MERYLIFGYDSYYPVGGFEDLQATTDDLTKAVAYIKENHADLVEGYKSTEFDYFDVFDCVERKYYTARVELTTETVYLEEVEVDYKIL